MANRKIKAGDLGKEVQKILVYYGSDVAEQADKIAKSTTRRGAKMLREYSRQVLGGTGKYSKGWTSSYKSMWTSKSKQGALFNGVIYNKDVPGLPHLLEHGHAKRYGGRVRAYPHIAETESAIMLKYYDEVKKIL